MEDKEQPRTRNRQACHHMVKQQEISLIACIAQNGAIGFHNHLLYPIRQDMQRFKTLTTGHTVIMGRMTYLSLPNGPLPNRRNIIVSKTMRKEQSAEMTSANEAESKTENCLMHQHFNTRCAAVWKKPFPDAATKARKKCSSSAEPCSIGQPSALPLVCTSPS